MVFMAPAWRRETVRRARVACEMNMRRAAGISGREQSQQRSSNTWDALQSRLSSLQRLTLETSGRAWLPRA